MKFEAPVESVAYVMADSREAAWRMGKTVMAVLHGVGIQEITLRDIRSFREMVRMGVSDDEDLRIFEHTASDGQVEQWAHAPYFFTDDASLLGKWAEFCADLAANVVRSAIRRAR